MAEILGAVASGLSIARAAGEILSTGLKLKLLLDEIRDAPENCKFLLGQVEILATALCDLQLDDVPERGISATLCGSLRAATIQCRYAAEHLSCAIGELSAQLETHRGLRRRVVAAKLLFKKGLLAKLEHRLYTAVQCLTLTQQLYIIAWQRIQPDIITSRILQEYALTDSPQFPLNPPQYEDKCNPTRPMSMKVGSTLSINAPRPKSSDMPTTRTLKIGIPSLVGKITIQMRWQDEDKDHLQVSRLQHREKAISVFGTTELGLNVQFPSWLASRMVAVLIEKSYGAWQASLAVFKVHVLHDPQARKAMAMILSDDDDALYQAFERRQVGPRDRFLDTNGNECTLNELALRFGAWRICNYLLSSSRDIQRKPLLWVMWHRRAQDEETLHQLQTLLKKDCLKLHVRFQLFCNFDGDAASFNLTRRQIWPDDQFYSDSFRNHRIQFAWFLALSSTTLAPTFFRYALSPNGILRAQDIYTGRLHLGYCDDTLLHAFALGIGSAAWLDRETSKQWALVASEMLPHVRNYHELGPAVRWDKLRTPLFASLSISLLPWPSSEARNRSGTMSLSRRLHHMEIGMKAWLQVLKDGGVDLQKYGQRETELFNMELYGRNFPLYNVDSDGDEVCWDNYLRLDLVLIGFQYGKEVDDWKLWWTEHTDAYAGDFWKSIESSAQSFEQRVPGAWIDGQESVFDQTPETTVESCFCETSTVISVFKQ
ncbi:hypothetical protein E8E14_002489 [Neopestalotiopsis sp. 37M]|nr:hypothetical protein E8E14_002489 [Neopestalotiopsis sp. 37M]